MRTQWATEYDILATINVKPDFKLSLLLIGH